MTAKTGDWYVGPNQLVRFRWVAISKTEQPAEVKQVDEAEKERMWNLIKKACEGS